MIALVLVLIAYLPGALLFRVPDRGRAARAALHADERIFWAVVLSAAWSSAVVLALAAMHAYTFARLIGANATLVASIAILFRTRLRLAGARRIDWRGLYPIALAAIGLFLYFPPAEYIIGGRDPGTYINEGIQIAQRGRLDISDPAVAAVPAADRDLFFPSHNSKAYYGVRFIGFFIRDPSAGTVVGQFPHLYPAWIAIGYGVYGLTGALYVLGAWAIFGVVSVYMLGARLLGRGAAFAASAMLAVSLVQVWFARVPSSEMMAQALLFAGILAYTRAHVDGDGFFAPLAGVVLGLTLFLRFDAIVPLAGMVIAAVLMLFDGKRPRASFVVAFGATCVFALWYLFALMTQYMARYVGFVQNLRAAHVAALAAAAAGVLLLAALSRSARAARAVRTWMPWLISAATILAAAYAYFVRPSLAGGGLAIHDAASLHTFAWYLPAAGIAGAVIGHALLARRRFWQDPPFIVTFTVSAFFLFYKMQIWPEHFWLARRFVPLVMPGALLFLVAIAAEYARGGRATLARRGTVATRAAAALRLAIPVAFIGLVAWLLVRAMLPIRRHIEYEGLIPRIEAMSAQFGARDLLLVESANAGSDVHVFAAPFAYIYARTVLVLNSPAPDKAMLRDFLARAKTQYREVYFLGGGGTDLLSRSIGVTPVASDRFQVPEYERSLTSYPSHAARKEFEYGIYRFVMPAPPSTSFLLDVGRLDDLHVVRFNAKERNSAGVTFRWTRARSFVSIPGMRATDRTVTVWMSRGPRPASAGPAHVRFLLNDRPLGEADAGDGFAPYAFPISAALAADAAAKDEPARLTIETRAWNPQRDLGLADDRQLGVMVDRVEVR